MKLPIHVLAAAALFAVSHPSADAQNSKQSSTTQQRLTIGGVTIRPATSGEIKDAIQGITNFGQLTPRAPRQQRRPTLNSAPKPRPRPTNPAVTTPHSVVQRPRPTQGHGAPRPRPTVNRVPNRRPYAGNGAPRPRPTNPAVTTPHSVVQRPRPTQGHGAPRPRPTVNRVPNRRPQAGNGAPHPRVNKPQVRDHRRPRVRDHRNRRSRDDRR